MLKYKKQGAKLFDNIRLPDRSRQIKRQQTLKWMRIESIRFRRCHFMEFE